MAVINFNYPFGITQSAFEVLYLVIEILIGGLGILFNSTLLYVIFKHTPRTLKVYAVLLFNFAFCDLWSCISGLMTMQRMIFSGTSITFIFYGGCTLFHPYACYFLHFFNCHVLAHSQWILMVSFIFRYWVLVKSMPTSKTMIIICVLVYMPSLIFMTPYVINYTPSEVIREKITLYHPEYDLTGAVVSGNGYVFDWPTVVGIIYMCIPSPFIYGVILYFRQNTLQYLNIETCNLSFESKSGHRVLIRALTIQACIPVLYLVGISQYWLGQFNIIGGPIPEYGAFLSMALMPVITPVISLYYISPYRKAVLAWLRIGGESLSAIGASLFDIRASHDTTHDTHFDMRRQDVLGNDRPGVSNGSVKPQIALPDSIELAPIRLPRPHVVHEDPIRDIQDSRSSPHSRNRSQDDYYGTQLTPFPTHLTTRRLSSLDFSDLTPPSQAVRMRTARGMEAVPTTTDQPSVRAVTAASIPRAALRDPLARPQVADRGLRDSSPTPLTRPTQRISTPPHSLVVGNEPVDAQSITGSIRSISQRALYRNPSLSYQRFLFSLTKFPALVLVLMSLSTLWGRGEGVKLLSKEQGADIAALCTGGVILVSEVLLLHQHYNSYRKAKVMSYLYHIVMLVVFCGSLVSLVFAAVSFNDLKKIPSGFRGNCKLGIARKEPWGCLSSNQRISYLSVILGCDMLIAMLALLTMGFGAVGQALMKKRRSEEYQRLTSARAYTNQAMQY